MAREITITLENKNGISELKKYSNKAKKILNGNASSRNRRSSNIKITNDSVIVKKYSSL